MNPWVSSVDTSHSPEGVVDRYLPPLHAKGIGERILTSTLSGGVAYGYPGGWSQDRYEQAMHFTEWNFIAIDAIASEMARHVPHVGWVRPSSSKGFREKKYRQHRYVKTMFAVKPHEEVELVEPDFPLVELFNQPNAWDVGGIADLIYEDVLYECLTGNSYWWTVPSLLGRHSGRGELAELFILPSHWMWPRYDRDEPNGLKYYELRPFIGSTTLHIPPEEVIHLRNKNPLHKIDGYAAQQAAAAWIDASQMANRTRYYQQRNWSNPTGAMELDNTYQDPDDQELNRLYAKWFSRTQGIENAGRPIILPPGAKFVPLKVVPQEFDQFQTLDQMRDCILATYRVPKEIAGIQDSGSEIALYGPMHQFCRNAVVPRLSRRSHVLTNGLAKRYEYLRPQGEGWKLRIWWDDPTPENPEMVLREIDTLAKNKATTPNEIRARFGMEPWKNGDDPMGTPSDVPIPLASGLEWDGEDFVTLAGADAGEEETPAGGMGLPPAKEPAAKEPANEEEDNESERDQLPSEKRVLRRLEGYWRHTGAYNLGKALPSPNGNGDHEDNGKREDS